MPQVIDLAQCMSFGRLVGLGGGVDWQTERPVQNSHAPAVVNMVVRDQNGIDGLCIPAMQGQPLLNLAAGNPGVEEQLHAIGLDVDAVAVAAGLEGDDLHGGIVAHMPRACRTSYAGTCSACADTKFKNNSDRPAALTPFFQRPAKMSKPLYVKPATTTSRCILLPVPSPRLVLRFLPCYNARMTPQQFIAKWQRVTLSERSACQQHFLDLCELLGQPKPAEADPDGTWYTFEKGVQTSEDKKGWADVWMRDHFGWEYKGKHKDLKEAYTQLQLYREALENPPLMVVCDMDRFEVHTNFTGTAKQVHAFDLAGLAEPANLDILRRVFTDPDSLKPGITSEAITVEAAERFAKLADGMRDKGIEPLAGRPLPDEAHVLHVRRRHRAAAAGPVRQAAGHWPRPTRPCSPRLLQTLFEAMAKGGVYGSDVILWFNGGLFADADVIPLTKAEINTLANINKYDWASVEPSIFGTLFERTLDPGQALADRRPLHQPGRHRDAAEARPAGPAAARVGGGQAEVRRRALAQGGQGQPGGTKHAGPPRTRRRARPSIARSSTSPNGWPMSLFSTRPAVPAISFTWRSTCSWTWRRK